MDRVVTSYVAGPSFPRYSGYCVDCGKKLGTYVYKRNVPERCFNCRVKARARKRS
tara:strand:+ start:341 stop:505 length:165 start_codon:yes stop_codon:yes gene_type:complete